MAETVEIVGGKCTIRVGDTLLRGEADVTVDISTVEREGRTGVSGPVGAVENPVIPMIEGTFYKVRATNPIALNAIRDATVTVEGPDGSTYTLRNAWSSGRNPISMASGTFPAKFEGLDSAYKPPPT